MIRLRDISEYRSELMGLAISFIMAYHTLGRYAAFGDVGVEWFLLLSGVGLFFSLTRNADVTKFYWKRFIRIIPTYLLVTVPFFLIKFPLDFRDFIIRISGLNLIVFDERYFWFITLILICYLLAPWYFKLVVRYKYSIIIPFSLALAAFALSFNMPRTELLITRIPIFLLGVHLGKAVYEGRLFLGHGRKWHTAALLIVAMMAVVMINYMPIHLEVHRLIYFICGVPSLLFILSVVKWLASCGIVRKVLVMMGTASLEIYLIHESIVWPLCLRLPFPRILDTVLSYFFAVFFAYALHKLIMAVQ